jgi:hypothetical protein
MYAVDTNVYVYALDADEAAKQAKALELLDRLALQRANTILIWQVAGEFLNQLRHWESKGRLTSAEVEAAFQRGRRKTGGGQRGQPSCMRGGESPVFGGVRRLAQDRRLGRRCHGLSAAAGRREIVGGAIRGSSHREKRRPSRGMSAKIGGGCAMRNEALRLRRPRCRA